MRRLTAILVIFIVLLVACTADPATLIPTSIPLVTAQPPLAQDSTTQTLFPTWTPTIVPPTVAPSATPIPPIRLASRPGTPADLLAAMDALVLARPAEFIWSDADNAEVTAGPASSAPLGHSVYAVVAPFATILDEVTLDDVQNNNGLLAGRPLLLSPDTAEALTARWGALPLNSQVLPADQLLTTAWENRPSWAIVPFDELEPRWKVLSLDGLSPLDKPLDLESYPLAVPVGLSGPADKVAEVLTALDLPEGGVTNRDESLMTVVAMTGVTALVRATAHQMEVNGVTYPGEEVAPILQAADIAHISNEVSFAADCPAPDPAYQGDSLRFCSRDSYIELLEYVGVDVIELTGNHNNDWGIEADSRSLDMYAQRGWETFGGGANAEEAAAPLILTDHGNTIGFIGCNPVGPAYAWATEDTPGAASCTIQSLAEAIQILASQVDVVIVGIQYWEFYHYTATPQQEADFLALAEAGATIVSGSQGHHAQGFDLPAGSLIHYGLGNLFFDQMEPLGTRQTFIDQHVIYNGRHISTELWTGLIENWSQPRPTTAAERAEALQSVFSASGW